MPRNQTRKPPVLFDVDAPKAQRFETLVEGYSDDLYRYAYWLSRNQEIAQDVVQEAFTRVWKSLDKLRDPAAVKGWLFTIVRREHARLYERYQPSFSDTDPADIAPGIISGAGDYDTRTEAFALRRALETLSDDYREPLMLQVLGGFSCDEIAEKLDISRSAVMTRLFRARKQLRLCLTGDEDGARHGEAPTKQQPGEPQ